VYEKVWLRTQQAVGVQSLSDCPPMTVTYRLQGLDGEATEPMISEVDDDRGEQQDPEVEFALTGEMESCGGLQLLLKILRESPPGGRGEFGALLKLLGFCCKVRKPLARRLLMISKGEAFISHGALLAGKRV
jgi:E3 ubiquitin-protein ligase UBR4